MPQRHTYSNSFATHSTDDIDVTSIVLQALLSSSARQFLLILLLFNLWGLVLYLTGTCQRSVNFSHVG